jgi:hypothetical protein
MSFALNGTYIDGGTFNNVSGNMTQIFNSHFSHTGISAGLERNDATDALFRMSFQRLIQDYTQIRLMHISSFTAWFNRRD